MAESAAATEISNVAFVLVLSLFLVAIALFPLSELLLELYRRAVVRSMGGARSPRQAPEAGPAPAVVTSLPLAMSVLSADGGSDDENPGPEAAYDRVTSARRRTGRVYVLAGLAYAATMATAMAIQSNHLSAGVWLLLLIQFGWPVGLIARQFSVVSGRVVAGLAVGYVVAMALTPATLSDAELAILGANLYPTAIGWLVRARRIRAVAPLVAAFLSIQLAGFAAVLTIFGIFGDKVDANGVPVDLFENGWITFGLFLAIVALSPLSGWAMLRGVGRAYERKYASDQAISVVVAWLPFAAAQSLVFASGDVRWIAAGGLAFALFVVLSTLMFRWRGRGTEAAAVAPRLLVLRVFALGRRSRRLFDRIADRWRYVGSIQLIAGPDLATSTVEPHEFFDFLRRRLGARFMTRETEVDARFGEMDLVPDADGRFRVTDFFCHDHVWRIVLGRLAADSDVVLMDLRGFSATNAGCRYEIGELLNTVPLERIVLVVDKETDEALLSSVVAEAWARIPLTSPNTLTSSATLRIFRETGWRGVDHERLLRLLCRAVDAGAPSASALPPRGAAAV